MTKEEAMQLRPGDMIRVPEQSNSGWPQSYDCLFGNIYEVSCIDDICVTIKTAEREFALYFGEVELAMPRDLEDSFDSPDIKLLFGGDD